MLNHKDNGFKTANEQRKLLLITQGAMFRSGVVASKQAVVSGLRAESLATNAIKYVGLAAFSVWRNRAGLAGGSLPAMLPLLAGGIAKLWREPGWKPLARGALVAGAAASVVALLLKRKKSKAAAKAGQGQ